MFKAGFWKAALERALKSAAQGLIGMWALNQFDLLHIDWKVVVGVAGGAIVLSMVTSIASAPFGETPGSPSLVAEPK